MFKNEAFESSINDFSKPVAIDFEASRNILLLAFAGFAGKMGIPMFEFVNITRQLANINVIFLRDCKQFWYQHGLPGIGKNVDDIVEFLRKYTQHASTKRVVTIGNSGGGYAAILFAHLLQVDECHAFSPKTFINPIGRILEGNFKYVTRRLRLAISSQAQKKYFCLRKVLENDPRKKPYIHLYFSQGFKNDTSHASRLQGVPCIQLHPMDHDKHNLIRILKKRGDLDRIIHDATRQSKLL